MERFDDAHQAYVQASRIDPRDARTQLNLAYTLAARGDQAQALTAIACGLAQDQGLYRTRLLEKQQQILLASSARWLAEQERLARRNVRLG